MTDLLSNNNEEDRQSLLGNNKEEDTYGATTNSSDSTIKAKNVNKNAGTSTSGEILLYDEDDEENDDIETSNNNDSINGVPSKQVKEQKPLHVWTMICILSTAFAYGCVFTTLFMITLPVECQRIQDENDDQSMPKSVALGIFVSIAGITQLVSPLIGALSDTFRPPVEFEVGQRMPYFALGGVCSVVGLLGQYLASYDRLWLRYGFFFFLHMIGLNISYAMMIALIPDQVPKSQTGVANGILALLLVTGSLAGFGLFHFFFVQEDIQDMYGLYTCIVIISTILTGLYAHDKDAELNVERWNIETLKSPQLDESKRSKRRRQRRKIILGPWLMFKTMLYDPIIRINCQALMAIYTIDIDKHHDFFVVTCSRLAYYCGISVQTFFLYFLHDIIKVQDDPESAVAYLAVIGQISGSIICYPIGLASDRLFGGKRKPFVYLSCVLLASVMFSMIFSRSMDQMTVLCLISGAANGIYLTMDTSLAVDTLPDDYEDGPSGGNAQLLGIWGVAAFLGSALGPMIGGPLLYFFGDRQSNDDPNQDYSIRGYAVIMGMSGLYFLFSAISLRWVKNPNV